MHKFLLTTAYLIHLIQSVVVGVDSGSLHIRMFHYDNRSKNYSAVTDENSTSSILNMHSVNRLGQFIFGKGTSDGGYVVPVGIQALYNPQLYPYLSQIATYNLNLSTTQQSGNKISTEQLTEDLQLFTSGTAPQTDTVLLERIYAHYFNYLQDLAKSSEVHYFPVTFSIPNYMSPLTREIIKKTSQEVNFKISNLVVEESALALGVAEKLDASKMDSFIVIVDMGHVSSNFTIIRVYSSDKYKELHPENTEKAKRFVEVIRSKNTDFTGLKVTLSIYNNLKNKIEKNSKKLDEQEKNKLLIISNKIKSKLSTAQQSTTLFSRTDGSLIELTAERSAYEKDTDFNSNLENYFLELQTFIEDYKKESGIENYFIVPFGGHSLLPAVKAKFNALYPSKLLPFLKPTTDLGQYLTLFQLQKSMIFKADARILVKEILNKKYIMKLIKEDTNEVIVEKILWDKGDVMEGKKQVEALLKRGDYRVIINSIDDDSNNSKEELEADFEFVLNEYIQTVIVFSFNGFRNVQYHINTEQTVENKLNKRRISFVKNFPQIDEKSLKEIKEEIKKLNKVKEESRKLSENRNKLDSMIYNIAGELENEESVYLEFGKESEIKSLKEYLVKLEKEFEDKKFDENVFGKERIEKEIKEVNKLSNLMKNRKKEKERMEMEIKESKEFYEKQKIEIEEKINKWIKEKEDKDKEKDKEKETQEDQNKEEPENEQETKEENNNKNKSKKKLTKLERYIKLKDTVAKRQKQIEELNTKFGSLSKNEDIKVTSQKLKMLRKNFENRRRKMDQNIMKQDLWNSPEMKKMMEELRKKKQQEAEEKEKKDKESENKEKEDMDKEKKQTQDTLDDKETKDKESKHKPQGGNEQKEQKQHKEVEVNKEEANDSKKETKPQKEKIKEENKQNKENKYKNHQKKIKHDKKHKKEQTKTNEKKDTFEANEEEL